MNDDSPILFIELNNIDIIFVVGKKNLNEDFELLFKDVVPNKDIVDSNYTDYNLVRDLFKKKIYSIEQKLNFTFKEVILFLDNIECTSLSVSGFQNLSGSQLTKENVTYILNFLKSKVIDLEKKTILHIFNTTYKLDNKKTENLPLGLFGNFYSQEHSFILVKNNDYKNLKNILEKCNLRIKRIISRGFLNGIELISRHPESETFFKIEINNNHTQLIYFENSALKFMQSFNFGLEIVVNDISKVVALKKENIYEILSDPKFFEKITDEDLIQKEFFKNHNFRKIKKKLIIDIAIARFEEIINIMIFNNSNVQNFLNNNKKIFLRFSNSTRTNFFKKICGDHFSNKKVTNFIIDQKPSIEIISQKALQLVQFGWKKEALPIIHEKKTFISKIFGLFFK